MERFCKERRESKFEFGLCFGCGEAWLLGASLRGGGRKGFCVCVCCRLGCVCVCVWTQDLFNHTQSTKPNLSPRGCVYFWNHRKAPKSEACYRQSLSTRADMTSLKDARCYLRSIYKSKSYSLFAKLSSL
jgi:hypothetical protein